MLSAQPEPEYINLILIDNDGRQGLRVELGSVQHVIPKNISLKQTSILACFTHVGDWSYDGYRVIVDNNSIKCSKRYSSKNPGIEFLPDHINEKLNAYFLYSTKKLKLSYSLISKKHCCPTCFCKNESNEISHIIDLPELTKPENGNIGRLSLKIANLELNFYCYDEAFYFSITYKNVVKLN